MRGISACLLGVACRYDGGSKPNPVALTAAAEGGWIPFCPEQLGGLTTPRVPAQIEGGDGADVLAGRARLRDAEGRDVTSAFLRGAQETLALCRRLNIAEVRLKARSPSCGVGCITQGGEVVPGDGVTAALLRREGIRVEEHPE